jgi:hypothetical protein
MPHQVLEHRSRLQLVSSFSLELTHRLLAEYINLIIELFDVYCTCIFAGNTNELRVVCSVMTDHNIFSQAPTIIYKYHDVEKSET